MTELVLMVGAPGSGKTTEAKYFIKRYIGQYYYVYVSRDDIRFSLLNEDDKYFDKEDEVFSTFVNIAQNGINIHADYVLLDATHISKKSRKKILNKLYNLSNCNLRIIVVKTPLNVCIERNAGREGARCVPNEVIYRMVKSLEKDLPTFEEFKEYGFKKIQIDYIYS